MEGPSTLFHLSDTIPFLILVVVALFVLIWIFQIKLRNEHQVQQNKKIIQLLEELNSKMHND